MMNSNNINIINWNTQSIHTNNKHQQLALTAQQHNIHIYALTETHTSDTHNIPYHPYLNNNYINIAHHNNHTGGLMFIVHKSLNTPSNNLKQVSYFQSSLCSSSCLCISLYIHHVKYYICLVYRQP